MTDAWVYILLSLLHISPQVGQNNYGSFLKGGLTVMEDNTTHEFVEKLHERQEKDKDNKERQSKGHQGYKLPNKQH